MTHPFRVTADITPIVDLNDPSPGLEMLSTAKARFGDFMREGRPAASFRMGLDLRVSKQLDPHRRLVTVEALSAVGEAYLREWAPRLEAYEARMAKQLAWEQREREDDEDDEDEDG